MNVEDEATLPPNPVGANATLSLTPEAPAMAGGPSAPPGYDLVRELGRGGMGVVYLAHDRKLNRLVALKMILAGAHASPESLVRFLAEAEAVAALTHPGIVAIHEIGRHGDLPYFTLEYVEGGSLAARVKDAPLPPREAAALMEQIARAVAYAHAKNIIHRDLKPENVLLGERGEPKVTDFGLAKRLESDAGLTATGAAMGTPSYMAPEQAEGKKDVGPAADVWSLGAILYRLLAGRPPFQAATPLDTILQVVQEEPPPLRQLNRLVPRDLETVAHKCLTKDPRRRYPSAGALGDDLKRWLGGETIAARPAGRVERALKWTKRNPMLTALIVTLIVGSVASTILAITSQRNARKASESASTVKLALDQLTLAGAENQKKTEELERSRDELERSLARSLIRPMQAQPVALTRPEVEALWDLATSPNAPLRFRFVQEAIDDPVALRRFANRAGSCLHAAAGLNAADRQPIEDRLTEALRRKPSNELALALVELGGLGPQARGLAFAQWFREALAINKQETWAAAARRMSALTANMEPGEAQAASVEVMRQFDKVPAHPAPLWLANILRELAPRLDEAGAREVIAGIAAELGKNPSMATELARALAAACDRLPPAEAVQTLERARKTTKDGAARMFLAAGLFATTELMPDADRRAIRETLIDEFCAAIRANPAGVRDHEVLVGLRSISHLGPESKGRIIAAILPEIGKAENATRLNVLAGLLRHRVSQSPGPGAAALRTAVLARTVQLLGRTSADPQESLMLFATIFDFMDDLSPSEARTMERLFATHAKQLASAFDALTLVGFQWLFANSLPEPARAVRRAVLLTEMIGRIEKIDTPSSALMVLELLVAASPSHRRAVLAAVMRAAARSKSAALAPRWSELLTKFADQLAPPERAEWLVESIGATGNAAVERDLVRLLIAASSALPPRDAVEALVRGAGRVTELQGEFDLALAFVEATQALPVGEATAALVARFDALSQRVLDNLTQLERMQSGRFGYGRPSVELLAVAVAEWAPRMDHQQLASAIGAMVRAAHAAADPMTPAVLLGDVTHLLHMLPPLEAASICLRGMEAPAKTLTLLMLARGLSEVIGELNSVTAAALQFRAAVAIEAAVRREPNADMRRTLAFSMESWKTMPRGIRVPEFPLASAELAQSLSRTVEEGRLVVALRGAAVKARRWPAKEAALAFAGALVAVTKKEAFSQFPAYIAAAAGRLEPAEAREVARMLAIALAESSSDEKSRALAESVVAVAAGMRPEDAAELLVSLSALAPTAAASLVRNGLADVLSPPRFADGASRLATCVRLTGTAAGFHPAWFAFAAEVSYRHSPLADRELVELLKHPLCVDPARRVVLDVLERRHRQKFADQWAFVAFAEAKKLALDFTTPPKR